MQPDERNALIIGAGIGGLAAAIALRRAGYSVQVFERVDALGEVGAGLTLWPNAVRALRKLGLQAIIAEHSLPAVVGGLYTWQGRALAQATTSEVERRGGAPTVAVHRAELQAALLDALVFLTPSEYPVQFGAHLEHFAQDEQGVTASFADGRQARGSVLIGADGLHSVVRQRLFGAAPPRYAGVTAWRAVVPAPPGLAVPAGEYWGRGQQFGVVPLSGQRVYWFAACTLPEGQHDTDTLPTPAERKQALLKRFQGWYPPILALIEATPEDAVLRNDIYDRPLLAAWSLGRVTLLGDAAHPMTPNLGQGACQALEDAVALAASLQAAAIADSIQQALQTYQAVRLPHANRVVNSSRQLGALIRRPDRLTCWTRDLFIRLLPAPLRLKPFERFITYEV